MSNRHASADEICRQMERVRGELRHEVEEIVQAAETLADWRHYVSKFPLSCLAAAALVGFALVPNRVVVESPDAQTLAELARKNRLVVESKPGRRAKPGLGKTVFSMLTRAAVRGAMAHVVGRYVAKNVVDEDSPEPQQTGASHAKPRH